MIINFPASRSYRESVLTRPVWSYFCYLGGDSRVLSPRLILAAPVSSKPQEEEEEVYKVEVQCERSYNRERRCVTLRC